MIIVKARESIRLLVLFFCHLFYRRIYHMDIERTARISLGARLDKTNPRGIHIGKSSYIASGAVIFSHDFARHIHTNTYIGDNCFIGVNAIIMCGVRIGNEVVFGAGSVVTKSVPSNCIVAGNPARVIRVGIHTGKYGHLVE